MRLNSYCLVNEAGWQHMNRYFDAYTPEVREMVRQSRYNLCCACVSEIASEFAIKEGEWQSMPRHYELAIKLIENKIRRGE